MNKLNYGTLTLGNFEQFVEQLRQFLEGRKYTFVACNEAIGNFKPETRVHQELKDNGVSSWFDEKNTPPILLVSMSVTAMVFGVVLPAKKKTAMMPTLMPLIFHSSMIGN